MFDIGVDFSTNFEYSLLEQEYDYKDLKYNKNNLTFELGVFKFVLDFDLSGEYFHKAHIRVYDITMEQIISADKNININCDNLLINRVLMCNEKSNLNSEACINLLIGGIRSIITDLYNNKRLIFEESRQGYFASVIAKKLDYEYIRIYFNNPDVIEHQSTYSNLILLNKWINSKETIGIHLYQKDNNSDVNVVIIESDGNTVSRNELGSISDYGFYYGEFSFVYDSRLLKLLLYAFHDKLYTEEYAYDAKNN